jgi:large subunit ribosomal protein L32e
MAEKKPSQSREALKLRLRAKNKKPKFIRAESWKYDRFSLSWRKPRGLDNKIRRKIKGWPPGPSMGYKGPKIARFLHPSGFREVIIFNVDDLSAIDPNIQAARIAHTVGKRKRALIITEAKNLDIKILNFKIIKETAGLTEEEESEVEEETDKAAEKIKNEPNTKTSKQTKPKHKKEEKKQ